VGVLKWIQLIKNRKSKILEEAYENRYQVFINITLIALRNLNKMAKIKVKLVCLVINKNKVNLVKNIFPTLYQA
jgi:hypothetical protein